MTFHVEPRAQVIADTVSYDGARVTTMEITHHRYILAEVNTHRQFSRNSASSRAIPVDKQLVRAAQSPANPVKWTSEQPGMQGGGELEGGDLSDAQELLNRIQINTIGEIAEYTRQHPDKSTRLHKSILNRYLEPFMWHTAIVTSTEWDNFFAQRDHPDAQPEFGVLAALMREAMEKSDPKHAHQYSVHLPYYDSDRDAQLSMLDKIKVCVARCARVSYLTHDGQRDTDADIALFDKLVAQDPGHWSPLEHVAYRAFYGEASAHLGNFRPPWRQVRHDFEIPERNERFMSSVLPFLQLS